MLLKVSCQIDWRFRVALVVAHETGHRIGAIRQIRWSDIDMEGGVMRWRAEHDKSGLRTPDAGDRRGDRRLGRGAKEEPRDRRHAVAARGQESLGVRGLRTGARLVEERPEPRGTRPEARQEAGTP